MHMIHSIAQDVSFQSRNSNCGCRRSLDMRFSLVLLVHFLVSPDKSEGMEVVSHIGSLPLKVSSMMFEDESTWRTSSRDNAQAASSFHFCNESLRTGISS